MQLIAGSIKADFRYQFTLRLICHLFSSRLVQILSRTIVIASSNATFTARTLISIESHASIKISEVLRQRIEYFVVWTTTLFEESIPLSHYIQRMFVCQGCPQIEILRHSHEFPMENTARHHFLSGWTLYQKASELFHLSGTPFKC